MLSRVRIFSISFSSNRAVLGATKILFIVLNFNNLFDRVWRLKFSCFSILKILGGDSYKCTTLSDHWFDLAVNFRSEINKLILKLILFRWKWRQIRFRILRLRFFAYTNAWIRLFIFWLLFGKFRYILNLFSCFFACYIIRKSRIQIKGFNLRAGLNLFLWTVSKLCANGWESEVPRN